VSRLGALFAGDFSKKLAEETGFFSPVNMGICLAQGLVNGEG